MQAGASLLRSEGGPGRHPLHHLGNTFLKHAFWNPLLTDFLGFGLPWASLWESFSKLFGVFLGGLKKDANSRTSWAAFGGAGGRGGGCLSLQILQILNTNPTRPASPSAGVRRIYRLPPFAAELQNCINLI